ncbi:MAG: aldehyde dehydrogenase, partial [Nocardioidaceae bacterium]|nr:aldehyde dehydrogenase [Nocardioidaceae bacterium]
MSEATGIVAPAATTVRQHFYIDGGWSEPSRAERLDVVSPSSEEVVGSVPRAITGDIDRAVAAARRAFDSGPWPHLDVEERVSILEQARARLAQRGEEIAHLVTLEMGLPISVSRRILGLALFYVDDAVTAGRAVLRPEVRRDIAGAGLVLREPVGVVGAIVPWNGPFLMAMAKTMPALVAGCTVVLKPAAESPLDAYVLAEVFDELGLPPGVLNIVPGDGVVGEYLVRHPAVDMVSFTGSTTVGTRIGSVCGERLRRVCLELGGKSAAIVLDDADLSASAPFLGAGIFFGSGQACVALSRVLAPRRRYDEVVDALCEQARIQVLGDPFDPATTMGPLVSQRQ